MKNSKYKHRILGLLLSLFSIFLAPNSYAGVWLNLEVGGNWETDEGLAKFNSELDTSLKFLDEQNNRNDDTSDPSTLENNFENWLGIRVYLTWGEVPHGTDTITGIEKYNFTNLVTAFDKIDNSGYKAILTISDKSWIFSKELENKTQINCENGGDIWAGSKCYTFTGQYHPGATPEFYSKEGKLGEGDWKNQVKIAKDNRGNKIGSKSLLSEGNQIMCEETSTPTCNGMAYTGKDFRFAVAGSNTNSKEARKYSTIRWEPHIKQHWFDFWTAFGADDVSKHSALFAVITPESSFAGIGHDNPNKLREADENEQLLEFIGYNGIDSGTVKYKEYLVDQAIHLRDSLAVPVINSINWIPEYGQLELSNRAPKLHKSLASIFKNEHVGWFAQDLRFDSSGGAKNNSYQESVYPQFSLIPERLRFGMITNDTYNTSISIPGFRNNRISINEKANYEEILYQPDCELAKESMKAACRLDTENERGEKILNKAIMLSRLASGIQQESIDDDFEYGSDSGVGHLIFLQKKNTDVAEHGKDKTEPVRDWNNKSVNEYIFDLIKNPKENYSFLKTASAVPELSIGDAVVNENEASGEVTVTVSLSSATTNPVRFKYRTRADSAKAGNPNNNYAGRDFFWDSKEMTISAGQTSTTISIKIDNDTIEEPVESFKIELSNVENASITDRIGIVTIIDDDAVVDTELPKIDIVTQSVTSNHDIIVEIIVTDDVEVLVSGVDITGDLSAKSCTQVDDKKVSCDVIITNTGTSADGGQIIVNAVDEAGKNAVQVTRGGYFIDREKPEITISVGGSKESSKPINIFITAKDNFEISSVEITGGVVTFTDCSPHASFGNEITGTICYKYVRVDETGDLKVTVIDSARNSFNKTEAGFVIAPEPSMALVVTANGESTEKPGPELMEGTTVSWNYAVSNTGATVLNDVYINGRQKSPYFGDWGTLCSIGTIQPGAVSSCNSTSNAVVGTYKILTVAKATSNGMNLDDELAQAFYKGEAAPVTDNVILKNVLYYTSENKLWIRAESDASPTGSANISAKIVTNGVEKDLVGGIGWKAGPGYYQQVFFFDVGTTPPDSIILNSDKGGSVTGSVELRQ